MNQQDRRSSVGGGDKTAPVTDDKATLDLDAIAARADAASPGEWYVNDENDGEGPTPHWVVANEAWVDGNYLPEGSAALHTDEWLSKADAEFIAHARTDIPALLAALAAERDRADRAEVELDAVTSLDVDHFMDIWDSLPRVSYTTRVAMAQAAVELIKQATA